MAEGGSIIILKELVETLKNQQVIAVNDKTKIEKDQSLGQHVIDFKSWEKDFLICLNGFAFRIHFLLFGTYRINEKRICPTITTFLSNW